MPNVHQIAMAPEVVIVGHLVPLVVHQRTSRAQRLLVHILQYVQEELCHTQLTELKSASASFIIRHHHHATIGIVMVITSRGSESK